MNAFAGRLPGALAGIMVCLLVYLPGKKVTRYLLPICPAVMLLIVSNWDYIVQRKNWLKVMIFCQVVVVSVMFLA